MSKREVLQRHRLIISKLRRSPCNYEQLRNFLEYESSLSGDDLSCSQRTLQRDIKEIEELYHIVIEHNPSLRAYEIVEDHNEEHNERLMEAFEVYNALNISSNLAGQVILEKRKALGTENLYGLLHAIKARKEVKFQYRSFYDDSLSERRVRPVAIKEARNRWYVLAQDLKDETFKSFGLDRIESLDISNHSFTAPDYDPERDYKYSFGIINGTGEKPQKILLSFSPREGRYIKSLPLHHSQKMIRETPDEKVFEYHLIPTYDFRMEILSYGSQVQVLKPESLRRDILKSLREALEGYE